MKTFSTLSKKVTMFLILAEGITNLLNAQDSIFKRNREILVGNVFEINSSSVKYKRIDLPDGPVFTIHKADLIKIKYSSGVIDAFSPEPKNRDKVVTEQEDLSPRYTLSLTDGSRLKGILVSQNEQEIIFKDDVIGEKTINKTKIKNISTQYGDAVKVLTLNDGIIVTGQILNKTNNTVVIQTKELGTLSIPRSKIKQEADFEDATVSEKGSIWFKNPNSTRYLFAPSAYNLKKGEGYYQNIYGLGNSFNFGINNNLTIGGGFVGPMGMFLNFKASIKLAEYLNIAGGAIVGNSFFQINKNNFGAGLSYGVITVGNIDHNITIGSGYGFVDSRGKVKWQEKPLFVANGTLRVAKKFALVTENWIAYVPNGWSNKIGPASAKHYDTFFSYAFRYMKQRTTLDAGFLNTPDLIKNGWYIGVPYIGFVVRFGDYKDE